MGLLMIMGNVMTNTIEEAVEQEYKITLCDRDKTEFTADMIEKLRSYGSKVDEVTDDSEDYAQLLENAEKDCLIIIPEGFSEAVEKGESPEIISIARMKSAAMMSNITNTNSGAETLINRCVSEVFAANAGLTPEDMQLIDAPVEDGSLLHDFVGGGMTVAILCKHLQTGIYHPILFFFFQIKKFVVHSV